MEKFIPVLAIHEALHSSHALGLISRVLNHSAGPSHKVYFLLRSTEATSRQNLLPNCMN